jgi:hypothetical protein
MIAFKQIKLGKVFWHLETAIGIGMVGHDIVDKED